MYSVVVIDDNRIAVQAIVQTTAWNLLNCQVVGTAQNGIEGMNLVNDRNPDIVITDIRMPGYDGLQMMKQLEERGWQGKCIIISGYSEFEYARKAIQLGVSDFILKPVAIKELEASIRHVVSMLEEAPSKAEYHAEFPEKQQLQEIHRQMEQYSLLIKNAVLYIDKNLYHNITLSEIADVLGVSSSHFSKCFKKETGIGFSNYVTLAKMCSAREMLENPHNKVYEVANMLGYHDYAYFFQVFKKLFGYSPSDGKFKKNSKTEVGE